MKKITEKDILDLIDKYYDKYPQAKDILIKHSKLVAKEALRIAKKLKLSSSQKEFIYNASLLHDIGIVMVDAIDIGCFGQYPYVMHGYLGGQILKKEGFPDKYIKVCERHIGMGLSKEDINKDNLDLPLRDMIPQSIEEKIICFADKFFTKSKNKKASIEDIENNLKKYGEDKLERFRELKNLFL